MGTRRTMDFELGEEFARVLAEMTRSLDCVLDEEGRVLLFNDACERATGFSRDEVIGRPHSYWTEYRRRIEAVTAEQIRAAAEKHLDSAKLSMLVVGKWSEIEAGDAGGRAKFADLFGGKVKHLPLRDPLTLQPLPQ